MIHYRHLEATKNDSKLRDFSNFQSIFYNHLQNINSKVINRVMTVKRSKLHKNYNKNIFYRSEMDLNEIVKSKNKECLDTCQSC